MGFSRQGYWSGLPFPFPGIFPTQGLNSGLPHCRQILYPLSHQGSPILLYLSSYDPCSVGGRCLCICFWPIQGVKLSAQSTLRAQQSQRAGAKLLLQYPQNSMEMGQLILAHRCWSPRNRLWDLCMGGLSGSALWRDGKKQNKGLS